MKRFGIFGLVLALVLSLFSVAWAEVELGTEDITITVNWNGIDLKNGDGAVVRAGDEIVVTATTYNGSNVSTIGYYYYEDGYDTIVDVENVDTITIVVPEEDEGTEKVLAIEALTDAVQGNDDPTNRTGWQFFYLTWDSTPIENKEVFATLDGVVLLSGDTLSLKEEDALVISATPNERVGKLYFAWDEDITYSFSSYRGVIKMPEDFIGDGETHRLYISASYDNGEKASTKFFNITVK